MWFGQADGDTGLTTVTWWGLPSPDKIKPIMMTGAHTSCAFYGEDTEDWTLRIALSPLTG